MSQRNLLTLSTALSAAVAAALLVATASACASGPVATHPAMPAGFVGTAIDTDHFLVQPPASVRWTTPHANAEHPAVALRARGTPALDSNTFLVQPPATVQWTLREPAAPATR